jgi:hypothetical protein
VAVSERLPALRERWRLDCVVIPSGTTGVSWAEKAMPMASARSRASRRASARS